MREEKGFLRAWSERVSALRNVPPVLRTLPFLPQPSMRVLRTIRARYPKAWGRYGFVNAFNPLKQWYDPDVVGIDTGITMLMVENARTGFVWDVFMRNPEAQRGMQHAGFKPYKATAT